MDKLCVSSMKHTDSPLVSDIFLPLYSKYIAISVLALFFFTFNNTHVRSQVVEPNENIRATWELIVTQISDLLVWLSYFDYFSFVKFGMLAMVVMLLELRNLVPFFIFPLLWNKQLYRFLCCGGNNFTIGVFVVKITKSNLMTTDNRQQYL